MGLDRAIRRPWYEASRFRVWPVLVVVWLLGRPVAARDCEHTVQAGDTLESIAAARGLTPRDLVQVNPALRKNPNMIRIGQTLRVCVPKRRARSSSGQGRSCGQGGTLALHEVRQGESLGKIASRYAVDEGAILRRNPDLRDDPNLIRTGQVLKICTGSRSTRASKMCGYRSPVHTHRVVPGEHLGGVAGRYGVRRRDLVGWNPSLRDNPDMLRVGQRILVCPEIAPRERTRLVHTVSSGEALGTIAKKYGLTPNELWRYQQGKLSHRDSLRPGQPLVVWVDGDVVSGFATRSRNKGVLRSGIQLPTGRHYEVKWSAGSWGTAATIRNIQRAISIYRGRMPGGPRVFVGDISKRGGGSFPPHASHQHGRDVDIGYIHKGSYRRGFRNAGPSNLDVARTWALVKAFIDTNEVQYIFMDLRVQKLLYEYAKSRGVRDELLDELFQYPRRRRHGIVQHWRGHDDHFHVRFRR